MVKVTYFEKLVTEDWLDFRKRLKFSTAKISPCRKTIIQNIFYEVIKKKEVSNAV